MTNPSGTASTCNCTAALITAAGMSSRMKTFKPMLPLGDQSIIQRQIETLRRAGCSPIVVVTGHRAEELRQHLRKCNVEFVHNQRYRDTQMLDSIRIGLKYLTGRCQRVVFTPVDIPMFSEQTVRALIAVDGMVVTPTYEGKKGHPILLRSDLFPTILDLQVSGGLREILELHPSSQSYVAVEDPAILPDVDTPEEYLALLKEHQLRCSIHSACATWQSKQEEMT